MKEKVYLDSTFPSYYFDQRESLASFTEVTRKWWSEMSGNSDVFISDAVLQELNAGNYPQKDRIVGFISEVSLLPIADDLETMLGAKTCLQGQLYPKDRNEHYFINNQ